MTSRARLTSSTSGAERAPQSEIKRPADAATSNGAVTKPGKGSSAKRTATHATVHLNIPAELRALDQWVLSSPTGRPMSLRTSRMAKINDSSTWSPFDEVVTTCAERGNGSLPALALTPETGITIIDLDDKRDKPASAETRALFDHIRSGLDTYTERSRSGRGYHIVVRGSLDAPVKTAHVEMYDRSHFMTFTGDVVSETTEIRDGSEFIASVATAVRPKRRKAAKPARELAVIEPKDEQTDEEVIARASAAPHKERFMALHRGDWESQNIGDGTQSPADYAYVGMLWDACGNRAQVERLWLTSALAQRAKGQRADYIARMLDKVTQSPPKLLRDDDPASLFSDTANAQRIVHHMGGWLLYVPGIGWHVWDGARWKLDPLEARRHAGKLGRIIAAESATIADRAATMTDRDAADYELDLADKLHRFAGMTENVPKIEAALKVAEPLLRCDADKLDADPYLIGCTNGIVDLRTGELMPPDSQRLISESTGHAYDPGAECKTWSRFLARIFRKHRALPEFMQRLAGYWLTGLTDPPYLAVLYGVGGNGKTTLVQTILHAFGEYGMTSPPGLLMARYGDRHPAELAALQGRRFVASAESGEGGRLDEERIKALTGSDSISARHMYENFYTFQPTHKLALLTNHKPIVRGVDEGIWRRLLLIPFDEVIPEKEQDHSLMAKLRDEAPGVLAWAVEGARLFLSEGIDLPRVVAEATAAYRTESDVLGSFLVEEGEWDAKASILSSQLYAAYERWCEENGERPMSKRTLGLRLQERGFVGGKDRKGSRLWKGLRLRGEKPRAKYR